MRCRICKIEIDSATNGFCFDCYFLYNVLIHGRSDIKARLEAFERLIKKLGCLPYEEWDKQNRSGD